MASASPVVTDAPSVVSSGVMDGGAVQLARDLLAGCTDDYIFFQFDTDKYCLVISDDVSFSNGNITVGEGDWYGIEISRSSYTVPVQVSGSNQGQFTGFQNSGGYYGSFSGSFDLQAFNAPSYQIYYYHDSDGISLSNSQHFVVYGSDDSLPHLIEGSVYYAYAQIVLITCICFFVLISRIFRHVS